MLNSASSHIYPNPLSRKSIFHEIIGKFAGRSNSTASRTTGRTHVLGSALSLYFRSLTHYCYCIGFIILQFLSAPVFYVRFLSGTRQRRKCTLLFLITVHYW